MLQDGAAIDDEGQLGTVINVGHLRSIGDIARSEGHDLSLLEVRLSCLEVLALGSRGAGDDAAESGYWVVRGVLEKAVSEAAAYIARRTAN